MYCNHWIEQYCVESISSLGSKNEILMLLLSNCRIVKWSIFFSSIYKTIRITFPCQCGRMIKTSAIKSRYSIRQRTYRLDNPAKNRNYDIQQCQWKLRRQFFEKSFPQHWNKSITLSADFINNRPNYIIQSTKRTTIHFWITLPIIYFSDHLVTQKRLLFAKWTSHYYYFRWPILGHKLI